MIPLYARSIEDHFCGDMQRTRDRCASLCNLEAVLAVGKGTVQRSRNGRADNRGIIYSPATQNILSLHGAPRLCGQTSQRNTNISYGSVFGQVETGCN
jgi:hypothetical protein